MFAIVRKIARARYALELIAVLVPREGDGAGFGVVAEVGGPLDQEDSNTLVLGTIIELALACSLA